MTLTGTNHGLNKRTSTSHSTVNKSSTATSKPRVSSEPLHSKPNVHTNLLSNTLQAFDRERTTNKQLSHPFNPKSSSDVENAHSDHVQANDCSHSEQSVPSTHYTHGSVLTNSHFHKTSSDSLQIQIQPLTTQKLELSKRAKSGHSIRSEVGSLHSTANTTDNDPFSSGLNGNSVHLTTKPANLPQVNSENVHNVMQGSCVKPKHVTPSSLSKESTLAAIYGPQNSIPQRAFTNAEDFRKVKKIFLSEKQSGTLKESGMEFPCAPPATPVPGKEKYLSQCMRFPTMWHFDMCRLGRASAASF